MRLRRSPDIAASALDWLVSQGMAEWQGTGLVLTDKGRDWLLMAIWVKCGLPSMPRSAYR